tara:strand:+ start:1368 stop:3020 length:1653 start_codon:yes stop_codon:yes gene_type:complete
VRIPSAFYNFACVRVDEFYAKGHYIIHRFYFYTQKIKQIKPKQHHIIMLMSLANLSLMQEKKTILNFFGLTESPVISMLFNLFILVAVPALLCSFSPTKIAGWISTHPWRPCGYGNVIEFEGDIVKKGMWNNYTDFSVKTKSILFYISTLNLTDTSNIIALKEIIHREPEDEYLEMNKRLSQYIVKQRSQFRLTDNIYSTIRSAASELGEGKGSDGLRLTYTIRVFSKTCSLNELSAFVDNCVVKYNTYLKKKNSEQYFLTIKTVDKKMIWNKFIFKSNRTFDNMYISNKAEILSQILFFKNNKDYYVKRGIPYTLGLLFYGEPGTGKTSFIKALANELGRHIVEIPLKKINNCASLYDAFYTQGIENLSLKFEDKIIVLEDIDAMDEIVQRRATKKKNTEDNTVNITNIETTETAPQLNHLFESLLHPVEPNRTIRDISLSFLLNLMEGLLEMDGRIIIMTTNHIDKIDPALIRPGRIDMKIRFHKLKGRDINAMIKFYIPDWIDIHFKSDYELSQAEIMNIIVVQRENIKMIRNVLNIHSIDEREHTV